MKAIHIACGLIVAIGITSCSEEMEYKEYNVYDKDYITQNFINVGGFMTNLYNMMDYDFGNFSAGAMLASASDESEYSKLGNGIEDSTTEHGAPPMLRRACRRGGQRCIKA